MWRSTGVIGVLVALAGAGLAGFVASCGDSGPVDDGGAEADTNVGPSALCVVSPTAAPFPTGACNSPVPAVPDSFDEALAAVGLDRCSVTMDPKNMPQSVMLVTDPRRLADFTPLLQYPLRLPAYGNETAKWLDDAVNGPSPVTSAIAAAAERIGAPVGQCADPSWFVVDATDPAPLSSAVGELYAAFGADFDAAATAQLVAGVPMDLQRALVPVVRALSAAEQAIQDARAPASGFIPRFLVAPDWVRGLASYTWTQQQLKAFDGVNVGEMAQAALWVSSAIEAAQLSRFAGQALDPVTIGTPIGPIVLHGSGADDYEPGGGAENALLLLDTGGDDVYRVPVGATTNTQVLSVGVDLGGKDTYGYVEKADPADGVGHRLPSDGAGRSNGITRSKVLREGAALLGVGLLFDYGPDADEYRSLTTSQGVGVFGVGVLYDEGGDDDYAAESLAQGGAAWGIGLLLDKAGNDKYLAYSSAQGFGFTRGFGGLVDEAGDDAYLTDPGDPAVGPALPERAAPWRGQHVDVAGLRRGPSPRRSGSGLPVRGRHGRAARRAGERHVHDERLRSGVLVRDGHRHAARGRRRRHLRGPLVRAGLGRAHGHRLLRRQGRQRQVRPDVPHPRDEHRRRPRLLVRAPLRRRRRRPVPRPGPVAGQRQRQRHRPDARRRRHRRLQRRLHQVARLRQRRRHPDHGAQDDPDARRLREGGRHRKLRGRRRRRGLVPERQLELRAREHGRRRRRRHPQLRREEHRHRSAQRQRELALIPRSGLTGEASGLAAGVKDGVRARVIMRVMRIALSFVAVSLLAAGCSSGNENACTGGGQALNVCAKGTTIKGVDVYEGQGTIDWKAVKGDGIDFAITRVSDGTAYPDSTFEANWVGMKSAGVVRGLYQFFRPDVDAIAQADLMLSKLAKAGGLESGDLPPALDIEVTGGLSPSQIQTAMKKWLAYVEQKTGRTPMIYTAAFMSSNVGTGFSSYPLWVANYGATCPLMPSGWGDWLIWQYADHGTVAGIPGTGADMDEFNGSLKDLIAFATVPVSDAVAPPPADAGPLIDSGASADAATPPPPAADAGTPNPCP
jgi:lysozyme